MDESRVQIETIMTAGERLTLSVAEAGTLLGVSRTSAYAWARSGQLPTIRLGKRILVPKHALERLLENTRGSGPPTYRKDDAGTTDHISPE